MAISRGRVVLELARNKIQHHFYLIPQNHRYFRRCFSTSSSPSSDHPLLAKLLQVPTNQIKNALSDHFALNSTQFPWSSLLNSSSSLKSLLVLEWRLERMVEDNERDQDQYSDLISLCAEIRNVSFAFHVFSTMEACGIKPTTTLFNSFIRACLCSDDFMSAIGLYEIMDNSESYKPNSGTYDVFIEGFSRLRDARKMLAWYQAKKNAGFSLNLGNYESLISCCVKTKDFDGADRLYEEMMASGVVPNVVVMDFMLEGLCKQRDCDRVKEFLQLLLECGFEISKNMMDKVVGLYTELERVDEMEKLLETLTELDQNNEAVLQLHCGIIRMYIVLERLDDVEYSMGRMLNQGMMFQSPKEVEKIISLYFRNEAYDRLEVFLECISSHYKLERSTYDLLVAGYRRAGLTEKLDLVVKDMETEGLLSRT